MLATHEAPTWEQGARKSPDAAGSWPVDLAHLRRYTMGDRQLEREVLDLFAGELPKTVANLRAAQSEKDWKMATHTLKGSARAVGAWRLAQVAAAAEGVPAAIVDADLRATIFQSIDEAVHEAVAYVQDCNAA